MEVLNTDHLILKFESYIEFEFNQFYEEWISGKYKKYSECPSYISLKAILDSVNILHKYMGWERMTISKMISFRE